MPVCYCIVILIIAMIIKMVMVMINMMVITYRPLSRAEGPITSSTASQVVIYVRWVQPALSWRASCDRQISLSASAERAFANFRVKNVVFKGTVR